MEVKWIWVTFLGVNKSQGLFFGIKYFCIAFKFFNKFQFCSKKNIFLVLSAKLVRFWGLNLWRLSIWALWTGCKMTLCCWLSKIVDSNVKKRQKLCLNEPFYSKMYPYRLSSDHSRLKCLVLYGPYWWSITRFDDSVSYHYWISSLALWTGDVTTNLQPPKE